MLHELEAKLDSFDRQTRDHAIAKVSQKIKVGEIEIAAAGSDVNLHCHTFYSYNSYGYSPSKFAYLAKKTGLAVAGIVDFDVLDGVDEFLATGRELNLKVCAGMESRVFVPEFASRVINSPGEPGISYHMGIGFPKGSLAGEPKKFQQGLFDTAQQRNQQLIERVNKYLAAAAIDYKLDVLPLTPGGNATERHICIAYARKAEQVFKRDKQLAQFWTDKLGIDAAGLDLPEGAKLLNTIRAKTMKRGGCGYVQPDGGSFPTMAAMNKFILQAGAIPVLTWLDGTSEGEQAIEELADVAIASGVAAINIIPDRNYTPGVKDAKLASLYAIVELAQKRGLPVVVGTEMNSPGNKFVDSFATAELSPLVPAFLKGAHIVYAHGVLQKAASAGYCSEWAKSNFSTPAEKNEFFETIGKRLAADKHDVLKGISKTATPQEILSRI